MEATKFTEVGFHGRDVDTIIRDLVDISIGLTRTKLRKGLQPAVRAAVEDKLLDLIMGTEASTQSRDTFRDLLRAGELEATSVEAEVPGAPRVGIRPVGMLSTGGGGADLNELMSSLNQMFKRPVEKRKLKIGECRPLLEEAEFERLISQEAVTKEALASVEQDGIVFIDEIGASLLLRAAPHHVPFFSRHSPFS